MRFKGRRCVTETRVPAACFVGRSCHLSRKEALLIWERKLGTVLEALSVLGGRGPWSSCTYGTALPGSPPGGGEGSPHLGLWSVPPAAVTRLAFLDTEGWGTRPLLPMSPVKVMRCCGDFMESPACRGNTFLSAVCMESQSSPAEACARLLLGTGGGGEPWSSSNGPSWACLVPKWG